MEGLSQKAKRIFLKHGVTMAIEEPNTTLRKLLVHPNFTKHHILYLRNKLKYPVKTVVSPTWVRPADILVLVQLSEHQKETNRVESSKQKYTRATRKQSQSE